MAELGIGLGALN